MYNGCNGCITDVTGETRPHRRPHFCAPHMRIAHARADRLHEEHEQQHAHAMAQRAQRERDRERIEIQARHTLSTDHSIGWTLPA